MTRAFWEKRREIVSHNPCYLALRGRCRLEYLHEGQALLEAADPNAA